MELVKDQLHVDLGKNKMPIKLAKTDLMFFQQLFIQRTMSSSSIHELYKVLDHRSKSGVTNRLRRFVQSGLLVRDKDKMINQREVFMHYNYRMGKKAFDHLATGGFIDEDDKERLYMIHKRFRNYNLHSQAVSIMSHQIWCYFYRKYDMSLSHKRGSEWSFLKESNAQLIPDWIFKLNDVHVMLEVDTGSERSKKITNKVEGYIKLAKELYPKPVHLIFSVLDKTVDHRLKELSRYKRIKSLKNIFPLQTEIPDNLHIYAVRFQRTTELVEKLLLKLQPMSPGMRRSALRTWIKHHSGDLLEVTDAKEVERAAFYPPRISESEQADEIMLLKRGDHEYHAAFIFGEEGSSQTDQSINRHQRWMDSGLLEIDQIIAIYPEEDQAVEDIIQTRDDRIYFSYRSTDRKRIKMYYAKSLQSKEVVDYANHVSFES